MDEIEDQPLDALDGIDLDQLRALSLTVAEAAKNKYPDLPVLTPKQVADVLYDKCDRSTVNGVRDRLVAGTLIPDLPKTGGRWEIPVEDLIRVYDGMVEEAQRARMKRQPISLPSAATTIPTKKRPWRAPIGPRTGIYAYTAFFVEMYREFDLLISGAEADELRKLFPKDLPPPIRR